MVLAPLFAAGGGFDGYFAPAEDEVPYVNDYASRWWPEGGDPKRYDTPYGPTWGGEFPYQREEDGPWAQAPEPAFETGYGDGYTPGGYRFPARPYRGTGLYEQFRPRRDVVPFSGPGRTTEVLPAYGAPPRSAQPQYRFRGDQYIGGETWSGESWEGAYRFRPLTEQERKRLRRDPAWRPSGFSYVPPDLRSGWSETEGNDPRGETYGYQPDSWFQRYYGERP